MGYSTFVGAIRSRLLAAYRRLVPLAVRQRLSLGRAFDTLTGVIAVRKDRRTYERQRAAGLHAEEFPQGKSRPIHTERFSEAGEAAGHYFHQDLLVAREIFRRNPRRHVDVGSSIYGFVSHVAAFREIEVFDVRPVTTVVSGIRFVQRDLMEPMSLDSGTSDSVSCLHALEHFGLGRYGDPIDYEGWRKGLFGLLSILEPQGVLYLGVPTGARQRVEFNSHRVFSLPFLRDVLLQQCDIERLAFVDDLGELHDYLDPFSADASRSFGADYGCSIWVLRKR